MLTITTIAAVIITITITKEEHTTTIMTIKPGTIRMKLHKELLRQVHHLVPPPHLLHQEAEAALL
jgi:hypothetical protein